MAFARPMLVISVVTSCTLLLTSVPRLVGFLNQRSDIWWTPATMAVPLAESGDRVEIYVRGMPLAQLLDSGQLATTSANTQVLTKSDVRIRFNNWDRVRAEKTRSLLLSAATAGAGAVFLLIGLMNLFDRRPAV
jgi:hypothetical protein